MTCCPSNLFNGGSKSAALTLFRVFFGFWLAYVGITKWLFIGADGFQAYLVKDFANTWIQPPLLTITGWAILVLEPLIGIWLLIGCCQRQAWALASLLMFMLTFGVTVKMDFATIPSNWMYVVFCLVALANTDAYGSESECCKEKVGDAKGCCN